MGELAASYAACRRIHARYGRSYYLATRLLPREKRPYVWALYGFARRADEIVDARDSPDSPAQKADRLDQLRRGLEGPGADPILPAVRHTIERWGIPLELFDAFLTAMRTDLSAVEFATYDDLLGYMHGSAGVIGLQLLPILEPTSAVAARYAYDLGLAFQLTNMIRDVGEDLRRGRLYLPTADLAVFGLDRAELAAGVVDARVRRLLAFEIARARELVRSAAPGSRLLHPTSRPCIEAATRLYTAILTEVERADYDVLDRRVRVGRLARARAVLPALLHAVGSAPTTPTSRASG